MEATMPLDLVRERPPAEAARRRVLDQHAELRQLLLAGLDHARALLLGDPAAPTSLGLLIGVTHTELERHLDEEESLLIPILEDDLPLGPVRAGLLLEEHARQRAELGDLCRASNLAGPDRRLAVRFRALASALLRDIEYEERELLVADVIRDDGIVIDQCSG